MLRRQKNNNRRGKQMWIGLGIVAALVVIGGAAALAYKSTQVPTIDASGTITPP
jgi:flagellar basal body-associated protein FliL